MIFIWLYILISWHLYYWRVHLRTIINYLLWLILMFIMRMHHRLYVLGWFLYNTMISCVVVVSVSVSYSCQMQFTPGWKSTEWTRRWADLWNDLSFSLCVVPSVYCVVATSDEGEKVRVGVSTDWYVAIEHWRLSSIRVYLCRLSD